MDAVVDGENTGRQRPDGRLRVGQSPWISCVALFGIIEREDRKERQIWGCPRAVGIVRGNRGGYMLQCVM